MGKESVWVYMKREWLALGLGYYVCNSACSKVCKIYFEKQFCNHIYILYCLKACTTIAYNGNIKPLPYTLSNPQYNRNYIENTNQVCDLRFTEGDGIHLFLQIFNRRFAKDIDRQHP